MIAHPCRWYQILDRSKCTQLSIHNTTNNEFIWREENLTCKRENLHTGVLCLPHTSISKSKSHYKKSRFSDAQKGIKRNFRKYALSRHTTFHTSGKGPFLDVVIELSRKKTTFLTSGCKASGTPNQKFSNINYVR